MVEAKIISTDISIISLQINISYTYKEEGFNYQGLNYCH